MVLLTIFCAQCCFSKTTKSNLADLERRLAKLENAAASDEQIELMKNVISGLSRQLMLQQLFVEERIRGDGHSGIKRVRHRQEGNQPYHADSHVGFSQASIHDHANYINTCGLGEFSAVMNGVEFRTRHNDYKLVMPHRSVHGGTEDGFHKTERIDFPEVPTAVLNKATIDEQITELREWFKAWRDSKYDVRDYRKYFRPLLCYLEGAWMADADTFGESFDSDRHNLDATSWHDMQDKVRFTSYTGRKSNLENFAYLPTTITGFVKKFNITVPVYAQWNYRILCHPVKKEIPLYLLQTVDDFSSRMSYVRRFEDVYHNRAGRFQLNPFNRTLYVDRRIRRSVLDDIMEEIPGKDNYLGQAVDNAFGLDAADLKTDEPINVAYYHRWYKVNRKGAMGSSYRHRGYSDQFMFAAMTNSSKIAPMTMTDCQGKGKSRVCTKYTQRWSFAVPLELVYLTPLQSWNPYDIYNQGYEWQHARLATENGKRNGGFSKETAFNGTARKQFYRLPTNLFKSSTAGHEVADTGAAAKGVLDKNGNVHKALASGIRTLLPEIEGVGKLRTRFPIFPVHEEGTLAYKEASALKELLMESRRYSNMYRHSLNDQPSLIMVLRLQSQGTHYHDVILYPDQVSEMMQGKHIQVESEEENGHTHFLTVVYREMAKRFYWIECDGEKELKCPDGHPRYLPEVKRR